MSYQFKDIEFKNMMYNPSKIPDGKPVLDFYKELSKYPEIRKVPGPGLNNDLVLKYIMLMYDKNTPYRQKYPDVLKRKIEVAVDVGFKITKEGIFTPAVEKMLRGKNDIVQKKIVAYIRLHRSFKYSYLVSLENAYYKILNDSIYGDELKTTDFKKISQLKDMQNELEKLITEIANEDENLYLKDEILRYVEEERLQLRPEDIALKLSKGEEPISEEEII